MDFRTRICDLLGIDVPVVLAALGSDVGLGWATPVPMSISSTPTARASWPWSARPITRARSLTPRLTCSSARTTTGGHNTPVGTMALIPKCGTRPAICRFLQPAESATHAALMLGADSARVGTAFLAAIDAGIHDFQKQAFVDGPDASTTISRSITGKAEILGKSPVDPNHHPDSAFLLTEGAPGRRAALCATVIMRMPAPYPSTVSASRPLSTSPAQASSW